MYLGIGYEHVVPPVIKICGFQPDGWRRVSRPRGCPIVNSSDTIPGKNAATAACGSNRVHQLDADGQILTARFAEPGACINLGTMLAVHAFILASPCPGKCLLRISSDVNS